MPLVVVLVCNLQHIHAEAYVVKCSQSGYACLLLYHHAGNFPLLSAADSISVGIATKFPHSHLQDIIII